LAGGEAETRGRVWWVMEEGPEAEIRNVAPTRKLMKIAGSVVSYACLTSETSGARRIC
jgi:hypothetical protein